MRPIIRTHTGLSLDGFMATPDGLPTWDAVGTFGNGSHGYAEFSEKCEAVIIGRTTLEQGLSEGPENWPWPDRKVFVLTSTPLPENTPTGVVASKGGVPGLLEQLEEAGLEKGVQLLGGARTIRAFWEHGAIDEFGLVLLPILVGKGIPLFDTQATSFSWSAWQAAVASSFSEKFASHVKLLSHQTFPDGAVHLVYSKVV